MNDPLKLLQEIQDSYKTIRVMGGCKHCTQNTIHLKATSIIPATGDTALTMECLKCGLSESCIVPIEDSEDN